MNTKNNILNVAESLFAQFGYNAVSMSSIAKEVKTTKAALYYHFATKIDLLKNIIEKSFLSYKNDLQKTLNENSKSIDIQLREAIIYCLKFSSKQSNLIRFLQKASIQDKKVSLIISKIKKDIVEMWEPLITKNIKAKKSNKHIDPKLVTILILTMVNTFIIKDFAQSKEYDYKKVTNHIMSFVI